MSETPISSNPTDLEPPLDQTDAQTQHHEVEGKNWTPEERQEISRNLLSLLQRRGMHGVSDLERYKKLEFAIGMLPDKLDSLLTEYTEHLVVSGVSSVELYILGGFARESTGQLVDPDNGVDTVIRPDTDLDIVVRCIPTDGIKLNQNKLPSPFSPIRQTWRENEISDLTDLSFYVSGTNVDLQDDKPRIQLLQRDLTSG